MIEQVMIEGELAGGEGSIGCVALVMRCRRRSAQEKQRSSKTRLKKDCLAFVCDRGDRGRSCIRAKE